MGEGERIREMIDFFGPEPGRAMLNDIRELDEFCDDRSPSWLPLLVLC
jgi:hypothetical protein